MEVSEYQLFAFIIDWLIDRSVDFNGIPTHLGLIYAHN